MDAAGCHPRCGLNNAPSLPKKRGPGQIARACCFLARTVMSCARSGYGSRGSGHRRAIRDWRQR